MEAPTNRAKGSNLLREFPLTPLNHSRGGSTSKEVPALEFRYKRVGVSKLENPENPRKRAVYLWLLLETTPKEHPFNGKDVENTLLSPPVESLE